METSSEKILDISWGTIFKISTAILIFFLIYQIRDIFILVVFSVILSALFNPAIDFLVARRVPRALSVVFVYLLFFAVLGSAVFMVVPIFIREINYFTDIFRINYEKLAPVLQGLGGEAFQNYESFTRTIEVQLSSAASSIFSAVAAFFGGIFSTFTIFSIAIFISFEEKGIEKTLSLLFPKKYEAAVLNIWQICQNRVSLWFGSRILSSFSVALMTFIACKILGINYAISFSLLAGVANIIPMIGPLFAGAAMVLFTLLTSWEKAIFILIIAILIQQIENNFISPILTKKFIGMPPVLVLIALIVGGSLWGVMGAVLSMPLFGILFEFTKEFLKKKREEGAVVL